MMAGRGMRTRRERETMRLGERPRSRAVTARCLAPGSVWSRRVMETGWTRQTSAEAGGFDILDNTWASRCSFGWLGGGHNLHIPLPRYTPSFLSRRDCYNCRIQGRLTTGLRCVLFILFQSVQRWSEAVELGGREVEKSRPVTSYMGPKTSRTLHGHVVDVDDVAGGSWTAVKKARALHSSASAADLGNGMVGPMWPLQAGPGTIAHGSVLR